jgi:hypothetical protein
MRSERERLLDILEAIERIEKYTARGKLTFEKDELIQNWVISHIKAILKTSWNAILIARSNPWQVFLQRSNPPGIFI